MIRSDYLFVDQDHNILNRHNRHLARASELTFRFDKSPVNWSKRWFAWADHDFLNRVDLMLETDECADALGLGPKDPVAAFLDQHGKRRYINGAAIKDTLAMIHQIAYPDPNHYSHTVAAKFSSHSIRVTAAAALLSAGVPQFKS